MTWRDVGAGELRSEHVGERHTLAGWVARRRDHGGLVFIDLRDSTGISQLVVNPERSPEAAAAAHDIRNEFVLRAEGEVAARAPENVNPNLPTGEVELQVDKLDIVSTSPPLPFQLDEENVDETLRFRYRWLDLRRDKLQRNIRLRARAVSVIRREMEAAGFVDIETPIMAKPTPEGARDFLVPTRLQKGRFFALPQSPQIYKQLLVIGGFERYYQIARCFRDEDVRADRVQELTQLDVEMAFPDREYIFELIERTFSAVWRETIGVELPTPFPRMTYADAMLRYGSDKPDLRFGLEIEDATEIDARLRVQGLRGRAGRSPTCGSRRSSRAPTSRSSRSSRRSGARRGSRTSSTARTESRGRRSRSSFRRMSSRPSEASLGSTVLFGADRPEIVARVLGNVRLRLGNELGLIDEGTWRPLWVTDFPMFDWDEDEQRWKANHHPFTAPTPESEPMLEKDPGRAIAAGLRLRRERQRAWVGVDQDPPGRDSATGLRPAGHLVRRAAFALRFPPRRPRDGRAAARGHCSGHRQDGDGPRR